MGVLEPPAEGRPDGRRLDLVRDEKDAVHHSLDARSVGHEAPRICSFLLSCPCAAQGPATTQRRESGTLLLLRPGGAAANVHVHAHVHVG